VQTPELDAFRSECAAIDQTLADVPTDAWTRTALGSWTLAELVAHLVRGVSRLTAYVDRAVEGGEAAVDRFTYYEGVREMAADVAARAVDEARKVDAETLPALFVEAWQADADLAESLPADRLILTIRGPMRADEYVATRVLEVTIHHMDLRRALDLPANPTPEAGRLAMELLEGMLGAPHPHNMGRVRFLLTATGRMPSDDDRFPLLA
jgi:uncharacterized protein (TIGR03083 family)